MTTDTGMKLKVDTTENERYQQLLNFITIDVLKIKEQYPSSLYIITLLMTTIINSSFNKHPISWGIIHFRLLHRSKSVMKAMCRHQTLDGLPKHCPNKMNKSTCTICYTEKMITLSKGTTSETSNFQPGEIIHMYFAFYNVTSICGFTSMITVICAKTRTIWVCRTASKLSPVRIICFVLTTLCFCLSFFFKIRFHLTARFVYIY